MKYPHKLLKMSDSTVPADTVEVGITDDNFVYIEVAISTSSDLPAIVLLDADKTDSLIRALQTARNRYIN